MLYLYFRIWITNSEWIIFCNCICMHANLMMTFLWSKKLYLKKWLFFHLISRKLNHFNYYLPSKNGYWILHNILSLEVLVHFRLFMPTVTSTHKWVGGGTMKLNRASYVLLNAGNCCNFQQFCLNCLNKKLWIEIKCRTVLKRLSKLYFKT